MKIDNARLYGKYITKTSSGKYITKTSSCVVGSGPIKCIRHDLNTKDIVIRCSNIKGEEIFPNMTIIDENTIEVYDADVFGIIVFATISVSDDIILIEDE